MGDLKVTEVFCEILSGAAVLGLAALSLEVAGVVTLEELARWVADSLSIGDVAVVVVVSYLLGLLMDAVGLALGELFIDSLVGSGTHWLTPTSDEKLAFWASVPEHVLKYRDVQWAYYSAYRNLSILVIPMVVLAILVAVRRCHPLAALGILAAGVGLEVSIFRSMRTLLRIYADLTKIDYRKASG